MNSWSLERNKSSILLFCSFFLDEGAVLFPGFMANNYKSFVSFRFFEV